MAKRKMGELTSNGGVDLFRVAITPTATELIVGTPTVTTSNAGVTISETAVNTTDTVISGITYPAYTLITFKATSALGAVQNEIPVNVDVSYSATGGIVRHVNSAYILVKNRISG